MRPGNRHGCARQWGEQYGRRYAQSDLRRAYVGGGPEVIVSSVVWFASPMIERGGCRDGLYRPFLRGDAHLPARYLACRFLFRREGNRRSIRLGLALESTIAMIGGLLAPGCSCRSGPDLVFPSPRSRSAPFFVFRRFTAIAVLAARRPHHRGGLLAFAKSHWSPRHIFAGA